MAELELTVTNPGEFALGLVCNVIELRWWTMKPVYKAAGTNLADPKVQRAIAEQVVDITIHRFGNGVSAADLERSRSQFVDFLLESMQRPPEPEPHLKLVP